MQSDDMIREILSGKVPGGSLAWRRMLGELLLESVTEMEHANGILDFVGKQLETWRVGKYPKTSGEALKEA